MLITNINHIRARLGILSTREKQVIEMRFGIKTSDKMTLQAIGNEMNFTRERIRQIESQALDKIRMFEKELTGFDKQN